VVEVDPLEVGVGSCRLSSADDKMHPCTFLSHHLLPSERNCDIGNRELLAVKLVLEEWRHWLEVRLQLTIILIINYSVDYFFDSSDKKRKNPLISNPLFKNKTDKCTNTKTYTCMLYICQIYRLFKNKVHKRCIFSCLKGPELSEQ